MGKSCEASSVYSDKWRCENAIWGKRERFRDWCIKTQHYGAVGSTFRVTLSENTLYRITRVRVVNRMYHDYGEQILTIIQTIKFNCDSKNFS